MRKTNWSSGETMQRLLAKMNEVCLKCYRRFAEKLTEIQVLSLAVAKWWVFHFTNVALSIFKHKYKVTVIKSIYSRVVYVFRDR